MRLQSQRRDQLAINRDPLLLHPFLRSSIPIAEELGFYLFEGWRSRARQAHLLAKGRTWNKVSVHQYALAEDFAFLVDGIEGKWSWDARHPWGKLRAALRSYGLQDLGDKEMAHFQLCGLKAAKTWPVEFRPDDWVATLRTVAGEDAPRWAGGRL